MDGGIIDGKNISVTFYRDFEKYREKMKRNRQTPQPFVGRGRRSRATWRPSQFGPSRPRMENQSRYVSAPHSKSDSRKSPVRGRFERERRYEETRRREPSDSRATSRTSVSDESEDSYLRHSHRPSVYPKRRRSSSEESRTSSDSSSRRPRRSRKHSSRRRRSHKRRHSKSSLER